MDVERGEEEKLWACKLLADLSACRYFCSPMSKSCDRLSAGENAPPGAAIRMFSTLEQKPIIVIELLRNTTLLASVHLEMDLKKGKHEK